MKQSTKYWFMYILPAFLPTQAVSAGYIELPDHELETLRGKYIDTSGTLYFGLEMHTQWHTSQGIDHQVGMNIDFSFNHQLVPSVSVSYQGSLGEEKDTTPQISIPSTVSNYASSTVESASTVATAPSHSSTTNDSEKSSGLTNISGIVQANQIASANNQVVNQVDLSVKPLSIPTVNESTPGSSTDINHSPTQLTHSTQFETTQGVQTHLVAENNSLGYQVNLPGQGTVTQLINGKSLRQAGQILQINQLYGSGNQLFNQLRLKLSTDTGSRRRYDFQSSHFSRQLTP
jgi:hypothetical protein